MQEPKQAAVSGAGQREVSAMSELNDKLRTNAEISTDLISRLHEMEVNLFGEPVTQSLRELMEVANSESARIAPNGLVNTLTSHTHHTHEMLSIVSQSLATIQAKGLQL